MKNKRGRKSMYESHVQPYLEKIKEWITEGATEKEIAKSLGISVSVFYDYKNKYPELSEACKYSRQDLVLEARKKLIRRAFGYHYTETKKYITRDKETGKEVVRIEESEKWQPEDVGALAMILRNFDDTYSDKDKQQTEIAKEDLELRKKLAEEKMF